MPWRFVLTSEDAAKKNMHSCFLECMFFFILKFTHFNRISENFQYFIEHLFLTIAAKSATIAIAKNRTKFRLCLKRRFESSESGESDMDKRNRKTSNHITEKR